MCFLDERVAHDGDVTRNHKNDDGWYIFEKFPLVGVLVSAY